MVGLRQALVVSTLLLGVLSSPYHHEQENSIVDWDQFHAILDSIDTAAIHHALHSLSPKFKDGVFSKDRSAIEQVHSENPAIASKLVHIARRNTGNSTSSTPAPSPSTPEQSSAVAQSSSRAASVSSALSSAIYASTVPPATTIVVAPTTPHSATPVATTSDAVIFSSFGGGLVTVTSSAEAVDFTPSTSTHFFYTTLPNGRLQTQTSVVIVNAPMTHDGGDAQAATGSAGSAATTGSSSNPGLQSGASRLTRGFVTEIVLMLGGAAAAFAMVL